LKEKKITQVGLGPLVSTLELSATENNCGIKGFYVAGLVTSMQSLQVFCGLKIGFLFYQLQF
jgi:hypothetical protein